MASKTILIWALFGVAQPALTDNLETIIAYVEVCHFCIVRRGVLWIYPGRECIHRHIYVQFSVLNLVQLFQQLCESLSEEFVEVGRRGELILFRRVKSDEHVDDSGGREHALN